MKITKYMNWMAGAAAVCALGLMIVSVRACRDDCQYVQSGFPLALGGLWSPGAAAELPDELVVLVIGVDRRQGGRDVHCDAIHQIHLDIANDEIEFVNAPRGTYSAIAMPEGWEPSEELREAALGSWQSEREEAQGELGAEQEGVLEEGEEVKPLPEELVRLAWQKEQYISNVCQYISEDAFVERVDRLTGLKTDYRVLVGFSQAQGILRALQFDPVSTLQFLRHRQTYGLGDVQRSYNQSIFLQDLLVEHAEALDAIPLPGKVALFQFLDTDMPWGVARSLLQWLMNSPARTEAGHISHRTAPSSTPVAQVMHLDPEASREQVAQLIDRLRHYKEVPLADVEMTIQDHAQGQLSRVYDALVDRDLLTARAVLDGLLEQQVWQQLQDAEARRRVLRDVALLQGTVRWYETQSSQEVLKAIAPLESGLELEGATRELKELNQFVRNLLAGRVPTGV